ncbi:MAG: hypothetical protein PHT02_00955 [Tissierellia bacterium]|nr:hypothetical protein [Tissierellia bacterium]
MSNFEKKREDVLYFKKIKQFKNSIDICQTVLDIIEKNNIDNNSDKWFFNLQLGINYKRLKQCKKALTYIEKSIQYCYTQDEYMESIWMFGCCNDMLGNKKRALKFYNKCLNYYKRNKMFMEETYMLFNIGRLYKDIDTINKVINMYKLNNVDSFRLDNAYETLFELYIEKNDLKNAKVIVDNIINLDTRKNLIVKISNTKNI